MKITVAICTWNRAELLDQTLSVMRNLRIPSNVEWELLIVNNNCTDDTDRVIAQHTGHLPIVRLFEGTQGQSAARNHVLRVARGELIIWTDDDVLVDKDWLAAYVTAARDWPEADYFGGPIQPWFAVPPPRWIECNLPILAVVYALNQYGDQVRFLNAREIPFGANMAFRAEAVRGLRFDESLGIVGREQLRGDEIDFLRRLGQTGTKGLWVGNAPVKHYIPAGRLTSQYVWDWHTGAGRTYVRQQRLQPCKTLWGAPRWVIRQYVAARAKTSALSVFKNRVWCRAFCSAAFLGGIIFETRRKSALPEVP